MNKIAVLVGIEMTKTLQGMPPFFKELNGVISHFALKKLKSQYNLLPDSLQRPCTHTFWGSWGLPCSHEIAEAHNNTSYLSANLIHVQWKLMMEVPPENHEGLVEAAWTKFGQFLELPEHALHKLFGEQALLETSR